MTAGTDAGKSRLIRRNIIVAVSLLLMFGARFVPAPEGLNSDSMQILGIFLGSILMWMGISIDWPSIITMVAIGLMPVFGFGTMFKSAFGADTFPFLVFTFMLTYPLSRTGFVRRCTIAFITNPVALRGPWWFLGFLFAAVTFMGCFISPSVLFVAFLPFLEDIYQVLGLRKGSRVAEVMMLGVAFCTGMSSGMTPIGHVWPTLAMGSLKTITGMELNQFQYMAVGIPTGILCIALMLLMFRIFYRPEDIQAIDPAGALALRGSLPPADRREIITVAAVGVTIFLWVVPSLVQNIFPDFYNLTKSWTTAMPPMVGCILLSVATVEGKPVMDFKEATSKGVLWASPIMCASTLALGSCLTSDQVGIIDWLSTKLGPAAGSLPALALVAFFVGWTLLQTNFASNIVTTTVVCSIAIPITYALPGGSVSVAAVALLIGMGAGFSFMTPPGMTAVNGVAAASGWTNAKNMFVWGFFTMVISFLVMTFVSYPLGSMILG
jgi:sodium-dependent dicarboxylate transporter 2/3/5